MSRCKGRGEKTLHAVLVPERTSVSTVDDEPFLNSGLVRRFNQAKRALFHILGQGYRSWVVAFSGGKDSTAALVVTLEAALEARGEVRRIDVAYADTLLEIPPMHDHALSFMEDLAMSGKLRHLPVYFHVFRPRLEQRFWVLLLGKGYPPPHQRFRWCTRRLKIEPVADALRELIGTSPAAVITGVRFGESRERDRRLATSCSRGGECGQGLWMQHSHRLNAIYVAPILRWKDCDVWDFLTLIAPDMGYPTAVLEEIYEGRDTRFGCWMCTVIRQDRAMERTVKRPGCESLRLLQQFRQYVWMVTRDPATRETRTDGRPGRLRLAVRQHLLQTLMEVQRRVGFMLIHPDEVAYIRMLWAKEDCNG